MIDNSAAQSLPDSTLRQRVGAGATWMVAFRLFDRLIGMFSMIALARLLSPDAFGLVAMATTVAGLLELFSQFGTDAALIRHPSPMREHYNTAWSLDLLRNFTLGLLLLVLANPASAFFKSAALEDVIYVLAGMSLLQGFTNVGIVNFRRDLQFAKEFAYLLTARLISTFITIIAAWFLRDHRALLIGMMANTSLKVVLSYSMHPYRPTFSLAGIKEIFGFSRWIMLQSIFHGLAMRTPNLAIGHSSGATSVGFFTLSQELSELATTELSAPIRRALYPGFSKLANDAHRLAGSLLEAHSVVLLLTLPIPIIIGFVASVLVPLLFGERWLAAVPLVQAHAMLGVLRTLGTHSHVVYMAINQPKWTSLISFVHLLVLAPLTLILVREIGPLGAIYALSVAQFISLVVDYKILCRVLPIGIADFRQYSSRIVIAAAFVAALLWAEKLSLPPAPSSLDRALQIALIGLSGLLAYVSILLLLWHFSGRPPGAERTVLGYLNFRLPTPSEKR